MAVMLISAVVVEGIGLPQNGSSPARTLLPSLEFQLDGRSPYVIRLQLSDGERIGCQVNTSAAEVAMIVTYAGAVYWSSSFSGPEKYEIAAGSGGIYSLNFASSSTARVWVSLHST